MTELVLRAGHNDHLAIGELLTDPSALSPRLSRYVRRVVVDATAIVNEPEFARAAYAAGTQLLVDPQTMFLTAPQHPEDNRAKLSFASAAKLDPRDLLVQVARARLIEEVVEFQLDHGATGVIPPYLHLTDFAGCAARVQRLLIQETAEHLVALGLAYPIFPLISVDQRAVSLDPAHWPDDLGRLLRVAHKYANGPIGLALSMTSKPNQTNLHVATRIWRRAARLGPFIAWHAGETGLLAVAMGAAGYEVGMCGSERYNARGQQRTRANLPVSGPRYQGAYIDSIGKSLERRVVETLSKVPGAHQGDLNCLDPACCPKGFASMLNHGRRQHAVRSRLRELETLSSIGARRWMLRHLAVRAQEAVGSSRRIRAAANNTGQRIGANPAEHEAMLQVTRALMGNARVTISGGGVA